MRLEKTLQTCEIEPKNGLIGEIYTSGLEMYAMSGMGLPKMGMGLKPLSIGGPKPLRCASDPLLGGTLGKLDEGKFRPIKPTETNAINLDEIYKKLRVVEKYHPDSTYKTIFGLKDQKIDTDILKNLLNKKKLF